MRIEVLNASFTHIETLIKKVVFPRVLEKVITSKILGLSTPVWGGSDRRIESKIIFMLDLRIRYAQKNW